jgi:hypothetical protein
MKTIAQNIGHPELFVPRTDEPAPNETEQIRKEEETPSAMNQQLSPASLDQEFDKHQQDTNEFVLDQKPEPDISDMPDLEYGAYDIDSDEDEPPELMTRENIDSSNDDSEDDEIEEDANTRDTDKFDDTMTPEMNILQDMEKAEKLIDQEIQEISDIHLHTPHVKTTSETSFLVTDLAGCSQLVYRAYFRSRLSTRDPRRPSVEQRRWRPLLPFR